MKHRPAPHPGPRCATHHRVALKATKERAHENRVSKVYGLRPGGYEALLRIQQGTCAICCRAKGISKKLSVDHDHSNGFVRGLLCTSCNQMLGHARDDLDFFERAMRYLAHPPAVRLHPTFIGDPR